MKQSTFVTTLDLALADKLLALLKEQRFEIAKPAYTMFSGKKKGVSCTLYQSGKLLVQGKDSAAFIEFHLEPYILRSIAFTHKKELVDTTERIGIDEAGKGDIFGPLCIAGIFADEKAIKRLVDLNIRDSKSLSDRVVLRMGKEIQKVCVHEIVKISPLKYNALYEKFRNLNSLLAWGHATAIEKLVAKTGCKNVLIDQFAREGVVLRALKSKSMDIHLTQRHRAEEDIVVAAASILARQAFLEGLDQLRRQFVVDLPKGASKQAMETIELFARKHSLEQLQHVAKTHFKPVQRILMGE